MDIEDPHEEEHFEDFTTASDWELFTATLERTLTEWQNKPLDKENIKNQWAIQHEKLVFADFPFMFTYFKNLGGVVQDVNCSSLGMGTSMTGSVAVSGSASTTGTASENNLPPFLQSIVSEQNEFPPKPCPHSLCEQFCLKELAILTSASHSDPINDESKLKVLLSSVCIALNNTNTNFPVFIQYHHWNQNYYYGISETVGIRTSFQMIHLKHIAPQYTYLSGLLDIFKSKAGTNLSCPVGISAHFFYTMNVWHPDFLYETDVLDVLEFLKKKDTKSEDKVPSENTWSEFHAFNHFLPFGCIDDPFSSLSLVVGWPYLTEDAVVDTATYSDLVPDQASEWYFGVKPNSQIDFRLTELLNGFWKLQTETRTIEDVLGKKLANDASSKDGAYMSALDRIAQGSSPLPSVNRVITNVNKAQKQLLFSPLQYTDLAPLPQEYLDIILQYLFPDASSTPKYPYPPAFDRPLEFKKENLQQFTDAFQGVKSAPLGSLVWRLAVILPYIHASVGGNGGVAHLWAELVLELRYRLENSIIIPGLERGSPNSGTCLLNQKLQMLNCCIEKKQMRETKEKASLDNPDSSSAEESEDEFFDCDDTVAVNEENIARLNTPQGRLRKCGRMRLLKNGEPMYIPITQDPAPLTEDVIDEQAKILVELGNDAEGSEQRAKMMSASLTSDMQSFKAANPGSILEDFVRWYSPRDWVETEGLDEYGNCIGELSPRMKVPGNLWLEVWSNAVPAPARRQRRLFDDTKEAEKVLHWMSSRRLQDVCQLVYPCLMHAATLKVLEEVDNLTVDYKVPSTLIQHLTQLTRCLGQNMIATCSSTPATSDSSNNNGAEFQDGSIYRTNLVASLSHVEKEVSQLHSFAQKFPQVNLSEVLLTHSNESSQLPSAQPSLLPNYIKIEAGGKSELSERIKLIFEKEVSLNHAVDSSHEFKFGQPVKRVFVLKYCPIKLTGSQTEVLPQRMGCCLKNEEFLLTGTFSTKTDLG